MKKTTKKPDKTTIQPNEKRESTDFLISVMRSNIKTEMGNTLFWQGVGISSLVYGVALFVWLVLK